MLCASMMISARAWWSLRTISNINTSNTNTAHHTHTHAHHSTSHRSRTCSAHVATSVHIPPHAVVFYLFLFLLWSVEQWTKVEIRFCHILIRKRHHVPFSRNITQHTSSRYIAQHNITRHHTTSDAISYALTAQDTCPIFFLYAHGGAFTLPPRPLHMGYHLKLLWIMVTLLLGVPLLLQVLF